MDVDALRVHGGQAFRHFGQTGQAVADHRAADRESGGAVAPGVELLGPRVPGLIGQESLDLGKQDVGVHVHGGGGHGSSLSIVIVRAISPGTSASRT